MRKQIDGHGLAINAKKLRRDPTIPKLTGGFQSTNREQRIHNLVVSDRRGVKIPKEQAHHAVELANSYAKGCGVVSPESLPALSRKREEITGWMHYCRQTEFSPARHIRRLLAAGDRRVLAKLRSLGIGAHKNKWWLVSSRRNEPRRLAVLWRNQKLGSVIAKQAS